MVRNISSYWCVGRKNIVKEEGNFLILDLLSANPKVINDRCMIYVMPEVSGFDIDREIDLKFLEFLVKEGVVSL